MTDSVRLKSYASSPLVSGLIFIGLAIYITSFWSLLPSRLPAPFDRWTFLHEQIFGPWWYRHVNIPGPGGSWVFWGVSSAILGLMIPAAALLLFGYRLSGVGLGMPNVLGSRMMLLAIALSILFGLWLLVAAPEVMAQVWKDFAWLAPCAGVNIIAEHFLISGVAVALLLPQRRLGPGVPPAPIEGSPTRRILRWIGLAQSSGGNRVLGWFGIDGASLLAIIGSGALFLMTHVGKQNGLLEQFLAFPGGAAMAYMTLRTHSIWPGIIAHWSLNLIPLGIWLLFW